MYLKFSGGLLHEIKAENVQTDSEKSESDSDWEEYQEEIENIVK